MTDRAAPMRLQRALARAGVASRRHAEELIVAGRVTINGAVATIGQSVNPVLDRVAVDGREVDLGGVTASRAIWVVLNKPTGYVTTRNDPEGRRTVFELAPEVPGLTYVGRLDYLTEGLLLLTTDGEAAHRLTHPSAEIERTYVATVRGNAGAVVREARDGIELEDGMVVPRAVEARSLGGGQWEFEITIAEGRNREVRRVCEALGLEVQKLVRTRFGPVRLGSLPTGKARDLTTRERDLLNAFAHGGAVRMPAEDERDPRRSVSKPGRPASRSGRPSRESRAASPERRPPRETGGDRPHRRPGRKPRG